jgi:hypothetical protein
MTTDAYDLKLYLSGRKSVGEKKNVTKLMFNFRKTYFL